MGTTKGLKVVLLPKAHAAAGLQALPATSVNLMQETPTQLQKLLLGNSKESCCPTHHSHTEHRPQEWE